jgi:rRNA maturation endonuclease Nob1
MSRTVLQLAMAQLKGGNVIERDWSMIACRNCGREFTIDIGSDPCAFCNSCKDEALDRLAKQVVKLQRNLRRRDRA